MLLSKVQKFRDVFSLKTNEIYYPAVVHYKTEGKFLGLDPNLFQLFLSPLFLILQSASIPEQGGVSESWD
jgi:hypothetical protein